MKRKEDTIRILSPRVLLQFDPTNCEDQQEYDYEFDLFVEELGKLLKKRFPKGYIHAFGRNLGWQKLSGEGYVYFDPTAPAMFIGTSVLKNFVGGISEYSINVHTHNDGHGLALVVRHHDNAVTGDEHFLVPCAKSTYDRKMGI